MSALTGVPTPNGDARSFLPCENFHSLLPHARVCICQTRPSTRQTSKSNEQTGRIRDRALRNTARPRAKHAENGDGWATNGRSRLKRGPAPGKRRKATSRRAAFGTAHYATRPDPGRSTQSTGRDGPHSGRHATQHGPTQGEAHKARGEMGRIRDGWEGRHEKTRPHEGAGRESSKS